MRISKLARTYELSLPDLMAFLESLELPNQSLHPNAKLDEETILKVSKHFGFNHAHPLLNAEGLTEVETEDKGVETESKKDDGIEREDVVESPSETEALAAPELEKVVEEAPADNISTSNDPDSEPTIKEDQETILSDQLLEMMESEELPSDLEKIKLIKAPKKELSGLKVLGKIDVPEDPRKKAKEKREAEQKELLVKRPKLTEEEKEERRLRSKKKKEDYKARKEQRKKEQENKKAKARKAAHYKNTLTQKPVAATKHRQKKPKYVAQEGSAAGGTKPRTILGKLWKWLNSSGYE